MFIDNELIIKDTGTLGSGYYAQVTKELIIGLSFEEEQNCLVFWMSQLGYDISLKITTTITTVLKRIYKGEGKIDLVSFYPYAFCDPNYVYNHTNNLPENLYEWLNTSGLSEGYTKLGGVGLTKTETDSKGTNYTVYTFEIYNSGDFDCPFKCLFEFSKLPKGGLELVVEDEVINSIYWSESPNETNPTIGDGNYGILINGYNQLIEKVFIEKEEDTKKIKKIKKLDKIYNGYINSGNWFNIPKGNEIEVRFITYQSGVNARLDYKILYI